MPRVAHGGGSWIRAGAAASSVMGWWLWSGKALESRLGLSVSWKQQESTEGFLSGSHVIILYFIQNNGQGGVENSPLDIFCIHPTPWLHCHLGFPFFLLPCCQAASTVFLSPSPRFLPESRVSHSFLMQSGFSITSYLGVALGVLP